MDKRAAALREALNKNDEETNRWKKYKDENYTAVENLGKFSKYLTVDVMVPIGQKAYMPGQLVHTNEVLVGHYQGYFSKCTAYKARDICEYRIKTATETLEKLKSELNLWQNKLEKPYAEGVFPNMNNNEIIEDYNEDKEIIWREKHKLFVKQAKMREKSEREQEAIRAEANKLKDEDEIFKMLEEKALMEELENELENLQIDDVNNETIRKLIAGDLKLPPSKTRHPHMLEKVETCNKNELIQDDEKLSNTDGLELQGIVKKTDLVVNAVRTNNNNFPNPDLLEANNNECFDETVDEFIKEQAKYLTAVEQIGFYEYHIKIMQQKLRTFPLKTQEDLNKKVDILNALQNLEELLEMAEDSVEADQEENITDQNDLAPEDISNNKLMEREGSKDEKRQKRRISFALQNQTLEFRKNGTVSEMLPKPQHQHEKAVIKLDEKVIDSHRNKTPVEILDSRQNILNKVEQNLKSNEENKSIIDFKLVDKILQSTVGTCHTLTIPFQHSVTLGEEVARKSENMKRDFLPGSPADFYCLYLESIKEAKKYNTTADQVIYTNAYVGENEVKVPLLKETDRSKAFEDKRKEFCKPETKSILQNKNAVEREQHKSENRWKNGKKASKKTVEEEEYMSAYYKVMNEVVEKPEPDPLPVCKYIDAHTPKRRVSRFKKLRDETEKV